MAKSFKEIGKKAEVLIEQGKEADRKVQSCQARVASSNSRVVAARRQLAAASETDENGNPVGNVEQARAQLSMAENQLAASQRALSSARGDADRVRQQKNAHVQEIERHNQVERSNLEKLRKLRAGAFGADSVALTEGMARRLNEAEDARVALLRSMGIDATADHVSVGGDGSSDSGWRGGGFATLDTSGQVKSFQGGGSEGVAGGGIAAPVGGGLVSQDFGIIGQGTVAVDSSEETQISSQHYSAMASTPNGNERSNYGLLPEYADMVVRAWTDSSMPTEERIAILSGYQNLLECYKQQCMVSGSFSQDIDPPKVLRKTSQQISDEGHRYIEGILDAYRDNLLQRGVVDNKILDDCINAYRQQYTSILNQDVEAGTFHLYEHTTPNFESLAKELKQRDLKEVETQLVDKFGASVVQLNGFDPKVAHDMADALYEAKRDFPELSIQYFGSCQSQAASMRQELTDYYTQFFAQYRQPDWTDQQFSKIVNENVEHYVRDVLEMDDTEGTFAWSLNTTGSDPSRGRLGKYSGVAVNLDFASDYNKFKNSKIENVKDRFKPIGCDSPRATMDHELGHEIDRIVGAAKDPVINKLYQEMLANNNAESVLSGYSKTSIYEFIAEGYSEYRNNSSPRKLSTAIFHRLIELRNIKAGGK